MRILVVDDHELVRRGIRSLLAGQPEYTICGEAVDGLDAIEKVQSLSPEIIIMDVSMPRMNGLEATREVKRLAPKTDVLIVTQHESEQMAREAFTAGASGYVVKTSLGVSLLTALARLRTKEMFFDDAFLKEEKAANVDLQEILQRSAAFEKALRESEERFRSAMNNMAEGLYTVDLNGMVTYINPAAEAMFGWKSSEIMGKKMHDVTHYKYPDGRLFPAKDCPGLQVIEKGVVLREYEDTFIRKDGSFFPVLFSASPLRAGEGTIGIVVGFRDDTKQRETLKTLRDNENAAVRLNEASARLWRTRNLRDGLREILLGTIVVLEADKGHVQLLDPNRGVLWIVAQQGFDSDFLNFFREVTTEDESACARALRSNTLVVIEDVETDAPYAPLREAAREAGYRAVVSTPIISHQGVPLGMMSAYFGGVHRPTDRQLRRLDFYVRQAADFIVRCKAEEALRESEERLKKLEARLGKDEVERLI